MVASNKIICASKTENAIKNYKENEKLQVKSFRNENDKHSEDYRNNEKISWIAFFSHKFEDR